MSDQPSVTWDDMVAMFKRIMKPEPYRYLVNPKTLHNMMINASDVERAAFDALRNRKIIIISAEIPEGSLYRLDATLVPDDQH